MSEAALADKLKCDVRDLLFPVIRSDLAPADLFSLLIKDVEPCRWLGVSGANRAAIIVYLGRRMGMQTSELESTLKPYLKEIAGSLGRDVASCSFLEGIASVKLGLSTFTGGWLASISWSAEVDPKDRYIAGRHGQERRQADDK
jgi:hypothetical protein